MLKPSRLGGWSVSIPYDRSPQAKTPDRGRATQPRDFVRAAQGNRKGTRARRLARKFRVQGRPRAPAVRAGPRASPTAEAFEALGCARSGHPPRPRRVWIAGDSRGRRYEKKGDLLADARRVYRGRRRREWGVAGVDGVAAGEGASREEGEGEGGDRAADGEEEV